MNYKIVSSVAQLTRRSIYTFSKSIKLVTQIPLISSIAKNRPLNNRKIHKLAIKLAPKKTKSQSQNQKKFRNKNFIQRSITKNRKFNRIKRVVIRNKIEMSKILKNNQNKLIKSNKKKNRFLVNFSRLPNKLKDNRMKKRKNKKKIYLRLSKDLIST